MAFMFGRGSRASKSTASYMGAEIGVAQSPIYSGYVNGYGLGGARSPMGTSRMPGEMTSARQYRDVPISQRATSSGGMPGRGRIRGRRGVRQAIGNQTNVLLGGRSQGATGATTGSARAINVPATSASTLGYAGPQLGQSESILNQGFIEGATGSRAAGVNQAGISRMVNEFTPERQYGDVPISRRSSATQGMPGKGSIRGRRGVRQAIGNQNTVLHGLNRPIKAGRSLGIDMGGFNGAGAKAARSSGGRKAVRAIGGGLAAVAGGLAAVAAAPVAAPIAGFSALRRAANRNTPLGINMGGFGSTGPAPRAPISTPPPATTPRAPIVTPPPATTPRAPVNPNASGGGLAAGTSAPSPRSARSLGGRTRGFLKTKSGKGLAIGAGALVIGGLAYSGRRGEGSSGGRTGMARY